MGCELMESTVNYGQELGPNLVKIAKKLMRNQSLCKLLVNTDKNPLGPEHGEIDGTTLYNHNIFVKPYVDPVEQETTSKIVVVFGQSFIGDNYDIESLNMLIYVYCPFVEWEITGEQLRPFAIMSEIRRSLQSSRINGLGEIQYNGFEIVSLTEQVGSYLMRFTINAFK